MLIKKSKSLQDELTVTKIQLQKAQKDLDRLMQDNQTIRREISQIFDLFINLGED
ncbi:MAG: hypothetical protein Q8N98_05575 [bacterium]|nr:hypothetical protein [bacterium]